MRIHYKRVRKSFDLETANKEEAATKARDIYVSLVAKAFQPVKKFTNSEKFSVTPSSSKMEFLPAARNCGIQPSR